MDYIEVPLSGRVGAGMVALVSASDAERVLSRKWYLGPHGYATSTRHKIGASRADEGRNENTSLHRFVMGEPPEPGMSVDHINHRRLDNRRCNLRWVTPGGNAWNTNRKDGDFIGVSLDKEGRYRVRVGGTQHGAYDDPVTAAMVYDHVVRAQRGGLAEVNLPGNRLPDGFQIVNFNTPPREAAKRSSVSGVCYFSPRDCWRVIVRGRTLGYFKTEAEAIAFRLTV
jgi:hypothetical protein